MDSKVVDRSLREHLWPTLRQAGFDRRSGRTAWRDHGEAVQCVNVQSFNSYLAEGLGATTYSFGVNVGVFFRAIASRFPMGGYVRDPSRPKEPQCQLRLSLTKGIAQPQPDALEPGRWPRPGQWGSPGQWPHPGQFDTGPRSPTLGRWVDRPDVWLVFPDGSNVEAMVRYATERVLAEGLPWMEQVSEPREAIRRFLEVPDTDVPPGVIHEMYGGTLGSPARWHSIASLAALVSDRELLRRAIDAMSQQQYWTDQPEVLHALVQELAAHEDGRS